ncbi:unnamed protein product [Clonostachys chloroleuca]|uniref:Uncharacterized protein n=1 Tax=Clonostachys chloroleuca TaxID=1926264 RepID=A0AA35MAA1_9HYPO|nr:unnamed protein product [Clonostachys chloroleuca]
MGGVDLTIAGLIVAVLHHDADTSRHIAGDTDQDPQSPEGQSRDPSASPAGPNMVTFSDGTQLPLRATQVPKIHIYEQQHSDGTSSLTSINSNPGGGPHTNIVSVEQDPETGQPVVDLVINDPKLRDMEAISKSDIGAVRVAMHAVHPRKNKDDTKTLIPPWTFELRDGQPSVVPPPPQAKDNTGIQVDTQRSANATQAPGNVLQTPVNTSPVMANPPAPQIHSALADLVNSDSDMLDSSMPQEQPGDDNPNPLSCFPLATERSDDCLRQQ